MAQYRKKPVVIEAFKYGIDPRPDWFNDKVTANEIVTFISLEDSSLCYCEIKTLEGVMRGDCGDYIIKGVKGEIYPRKPNIFEMTYEPMNRLDLNKLEEKLDIVLENETTESLTNWLKEKRNKNNNMAQTSIDWVLQYLNNVKPNEFCSIEKIKELLEQAKVMHKEEIIKARLSLDRSNLSDFPKSFNDATDYYNLTFMSE